MTRHERFGLWHNRITTKTYLGFVAGLNNKNNELDEESKKRIQQEDREREATDNRLNDISKKTIEEIGTRLWAAMYLKYLMGRIYATDRVHVQLSDPVVLGLQNLSLSSEESSPSTRGSLEEEFEKLPKELQVKIVDRRLRDACMGTETIWAALNELISRLTSGEYPPLSGAISHNDYAGLSEHPPDNCVAFRVFDKYSQAQYFNKGDIRCGNWQDFNVNEGSTRLRARQHIKGDTIPTDFISTSTSPSRISNIIGKYQFEHRKIAVIDLRVLDRLGIAYGSTTDDLGFDNRTEFATKHHVLVVGWIPARSILGLLSEKGFKESIKESQIGVSLEGGRLI